MLSLFSKLTNWWNDRRKMAKEKNKPFLVDDIKVVEDLGNGKVLTRAYYKGEPVGRDVIFMTTKAPRYYEL